MQSRARLPPTPRPIFFSSWHPCLWQHAEKGRAPALLTLAVQHRSSCKVEKSGACRNQPLPPFGTTSKSTRALSSCIEQSCLEIHTYCGRRGKAVISWRRDNLPGIKGQRAQPDQRAHLGGRAFVLFLTSDSSLQRSAERPRCLACPRGSRAGVWLGRPSPGQGNSFSSAAERKHAARQAGWKR